MIDKEPKLPSIGDLNGVKDPATRKILEAVKEILEVREGTRQRSDRLDKSVTFRDLYKYGLAKVIVDGKELTSDGSDNFIVPNNQTTNNTTVVEGSGSQLDLSKPPVVSGLLATGTRTGVLVRWDNVTAHKLHAYAEIWRSASNNLGQATLIGTSDGFMYADRIGQENLTFYYWVRIVSINDIVGEFNAVQGTEATTGQDNEDDILDNDDATFLNINAAHANLYSLSATKITTGRLGATQYITVGSGVDRVVIDGQGNIRAGATGYGTGIGMWQGIDAGIYKFFMGNPDAQNVSWDGLNWNISGNIRNGQVAFDTGNGFFAGADENGNYRVSFGNSQDNKVTWDGVNLSIISPNLTLVDGQLTFDGGGKFNGLLDGAEGTFAGRLLAGVLDFSSFAGETSVYLVPGTYQITVPQDKTSMRVSMCGAGGGGGAGGTGNNDIGSGGGGGGGSNMITLTFNNLVPGTVYTLVVGAAAAAAVSTTPVGKTGGKGGDTYITGLMTAEGGNGGTGGQGDGFPGNGGLGKNGAGNGANGTRQSQVTNGTFNGINLFTAVEGKGGAGGLSTNGGANGGKGGDGAYDVNPPRNAGGWAAVYGKKAQDGKAIIEFFNPNSVVLNTDFNILKAALVRQGISIV